MDSEQTARENFLWEAVERDLENLSKARKEMVRTRVAYDLAKEHYAATRKLASEAIDEDYLLESLNALSERYPEICYLGDATGYAAFRAAATLTIEHADHYVSLGDAGRRPSFLAVIPLDDLLHEMERGGFEFGSSPKREVSAAIINTDSIEKVEGGYVVTDKKWLESVLKGARERLERSKAGEEAVEGGGLATLERQLANSVLHPTAYIMQHRFTDGSVVDVAIRTEFGLVPVDSRFPMDSYRRVLEAESEEDRDRERRALLRDVRKCIEQCEKYIKPEDGTVDFALMYVPSENIFHELISGGEDVIAFGLKKGVHLASNKILDAVLATILTPESLEDMEEAVTRLWQKGGGVLRPKEIRTEP